MSRLFHTPLYRPLCQSSVSLKSEYHHPNTANRYLNLNKNLWDIPLLHSKKFYKLVSQILDIKKRFEISKIINIFFHFKLIFSMSNICGTNFLNFSECSKGFIKLFTVYKGCVHANNQTRYWIYTITPSQPFVCLVSPRA